MDVKVLILNGYRHHNKENKVSITIIFSCKTYKLTMKEWLVLTKSPLRNVRTETYISKDLLAKIIETQKLEGT